ncbi:histidine phosphatase family protein [Streptomyces misionensis]|uniref:histidine phosphatase family protein n=1 Tax=Streptomyces misionensis TaxID=67331 RepID=UPI0038119E8A
MGVNPSGTGKTGRTPIRAWGVDRTGRRRGIRWHAENRYAGASGIGLTALGRAQVEALGKWVGERPVDAVWCSPLTRAVATAEPACRVLGIEARRGHTTEGPP